jgi:branched-chain amino acid transport system ATP-binding protein
VAGDLLTLEGIAKSFGTVLVADNIDLAIRTGEAVGILGPNGAGKSTLFNLITGHVRPDAGRILMGGEDVTSLRPSARCRRGIGRSFQIPHPFGGMTVFENTLAAAVFGAGMSEAAGTRHGYEVLEMTGLATSANRLAGSLTLLDRKRLELARAVATQPRLLLLDEIAGGLTDEEAHQLTETIALLRGRGIAIVWIEHVVRALVRAVERLIVMNVGAILMDGPPAAVMASREVQAVYMGVEAA